MSSTHARFLLGTIALCLIVDVTIRMVYAIYGHFNKNRLLEEYGETEPSSPPQIVRITGLATSLLINLIVYAYLFA